MSYYPNKYLHEKRHLFVKKSLLRRSLPYVVKTVIFAAAVVIAFLVGQDYAEYAAKSERVAEYCGRYL